MFSFGKSEDEEKNNNCLDMNSRLSKVWKFAGKSLNKSFKVFIYSKCSETSLFVASCYVGFLVLSMHIIPVIFQNWIYVVEPRAVNMTDDKGDQMVSFWSI